MNKLNYGIAHGEVGGLKQKNCIKCDFPNYWAATISKFKPGKKQLSYKNSIKSGFTSDKRQVFSAVPFF